MARSDVSAREAAPVQTAPVAPPVADPGPLGLAAFAMTTFVLSVVNAGLIDAKVGAVFFPLALFYGGIAQVLAGMWEFRTGNTFGALAFTSYGAFWLALWWLETNVMPAWVKLAVAGPGPNAALRNDALGLFLLAWTIFTLYMTVAAFRLNAVLAILFVLLFLTFLFLTIGAFQQTGLTRTGIWKFGGWLGLVTAIVAWYASFAGVLNAASKRTILPLFPRPARS